LNKSKLSYGFSEKTATYLRLIRKHDVHQNLKIDKLLKHKSFFLLGARATGKSTLISQLLEGAKITVLKFFLGKNF